MNLDECRSGRSGSGNRDAENNSKRVRIGREKSGEGNKESRKSSRGMAIPRILFTLRLILQVPFIHSHTLLRRLQRYHQPYCH